MKLEYLLFNLLIISLSSSSVLFFKQTRLPKIKPAALAMFSVSVPYLVWDAMVTTKWWNFNSDFILGYKVFSLPLEELLFFITVPWSCLVIWINLKKFVPSRERFKIEPVVQLCGCVISIIALTQRWWYSLAVGVLLILFSRISKVRESWLNNQRSAVFLSITFLLTVLFNWYLTWRPVVMYNTEVLSTLRILTIPIEDFIYGLVLVGATALFYDLYENRMMDKKTLS